MWLFWLCAGALAAAAALLVSARAAGAARRAHEAEDPALAVHRRALLELDALVDRGVLAEAEAETARAEAGRRLLAAADRAPTPEHAGARASRLAVTLASAAAALLALAGYVTLGRPGMPDAPYARRLAVWREPTRLDRLDAPRLAAVLAAVAAKRPSDPQVFDYLGRARLAAGEFGAAATAYEHAARLAPANADYPLAAGEALLQGAQGKTPPEAQAAFREALRRDPRNAAARYQLARARIAGGDLAGGLAQWRALAGELAPSDPRRAALLAEADQAEGRGGPLQAPGAAPAPAPGAGPSPDQAAAAAATAPAGGSEQAAFIRAMVEARAARLRADPDDPAGWALLVRSYGVLGDASRQAQALAQARIALAKRPEALAQVEAQARSASPAQPLGETGGGSR